MMSAHVLVLSATLLVWFNHRTDGLQRLPRQASTDFSAKNIRAELQRIMQKAGHSKFEVIYDLLHALM